MYVGMFEIAGLNARGAQKCQTRSARIRLYMITELYRMIAIEKAYDGLLSAGVRANRYEKT